MVCGVFLFILQPFSRLQDCTQVFILHLFASSNLHLMKPGCDLPTEAGNEIKGNDTVALGKMLLFEAKRAVGTALPDKGRLYIDKCFLTTSRDPSSEPKYYVIERGG